MTWRSASGPASEYCSLPGSELLVNWRTLRSFSQLMRHEGYSRGSCFYLAFWSRLPYTAFPLDLAAENVAVGSMNRGQQVSQPLVWFMFASATFIILMSGLLLALSFRANRSRFFTTRASLQPVAMLLQGCALSLLAAFIAWPMLLNIGIVVWLFFVLMVLSLTLLLVGLYPTMKRLLGGSYSSV